MTDTVELGLIDTRYERLRLKDKVREYCIQSSIIEQGILEPLSVVASSDTERILLDGFKRYRCAVRLSLPGVPVLVLERDTAVGMLKLLRLSSGTRLTAVEEAGLIDELHQVHHLSIVEIARRLERSVAWVSLRLGLMREMSDEVRKKIFSGQFPVRSYLYSLRPFTRVKDGAPTKAVSSFVGCVSGKGLSSRDIDRLAQAYFKGGEVLKSQIEKGQLDWTLRQLKERDDRQEAPMNNLCEPESRVLSQLEVLCVYMSKLGYGLKDPRLTSQEFFVRGSMTAAKILRNWDDFRHTLQEFYDTVRKKAGSVHAAPVGKA